MLQRIQTVYMLAAAVAALMMLLFPLATFLTPEATYELTALGLTSLTPEVPFDEMGWALLAALLIMLVLPLVCIFCYRRRRLQMRILIYTALFDLLCYALFFWRCSEYASMLSALSAGQAEVLYNYVMLAMPALSVFCCIMAWRGVMFDEALVKSLERLR